MQVESGKKWGKNSYICNKCGQEQIIICNEEELRPCDCGSTSFDAKLNFYRSETGMSEKADEILNVIAIAIFLAEILDVKGFINVISAQLRMLLIDDKSLLKLKTGDLKFHPLEEISDGTADIKAVSAVKLFNCSATELIPIDNWLKQEVARSRHWSPITIFGLIHANANKNGGAHVDRTLPEKALVEIEILGDRYILEIAKYIMMMTGRDYKSDVKNLLFIPYEKLKI